MKRIKYLLILVLIFSINTYAAYPSYYNSSDSGYVTSIKNQGQTNNCWAFSTISMIETYLIKNNNYKNNNIDLSENHEVDYLRVSTEGATLQVPEYYYINYGAIKESDYISGNTKSLLNVKSTEWPGLETFTDGLCSTTMMNEFKRIITNYGSIVSNINSSVYKQVNNSFNFNGRTGVPDHAVQIIGWDDDYSKNNFKIVPSINGAWIIKNSWGGTTYDYVSYDDTTVCSYGFAITEVDENVGDTVVNASYEPRYYDESKDIREYDFYSFRTKSIEFLQRLDTNTSTQQYLSQIKFPLSMNTKATFSIKRSTDSQYIELGTIQTTHTGFKTLDVLNKKIVISGQYDLKIVVTNIDTSLTTITVPFQTGRGKTEKTGTYSKIYDGTKYISLGDTISDQDFGILPTVVVKNNIAKYNIRVLNNVDQTVYNFSNQVQGTVLDLRTALSEKTNYSFVKFSTNIEGTDTVENSLTVTSDRTIYAIYKPDIKYTIRFDLGNVELQLREMDRIQFPTASKTGYTFDGWYENDSKFTLTEMPARNVNLIAKFTPNEYVVKFNSNTGSGTMAELTVKYDQEFELPNVGFTKEGATFLGWSTTQGTNYRFTNKQVVSNLATSGQVTLYAIWSINKYTVTFKNSITDETVKTEQVEYNKDLSFSFDKTYLEGRQTGYRVIGYSLDKEGTNKITKLTSVKENKTVYILYEKNIQLTISFDNGVDHANKPYSSYIKFEEVEVSVSLKNGYVVDKVQVFNLNSEDVTSNYTFTELNGKIKINLRDENISIKVTTSEIKFYKTDVELIRSNNKVTLNWEVRDCLKYIIYRSETGKTGTWKSIAKINDKNTTTYVDKSLTYGKKYYYIVAVDDGKTKLNSDSVNTTIKPEKVINGKVDKALSTTITISYDKVSVTGYQIYRSTKNETGTWTLVKTITSNSTLTFKDKGLKSNKTYYYKVRAYKSVNGKNYYGNFSDAIVAKTGPSKSEIKIARDFNTKINDEIKLNYNISYTKSSGATSYKLYYSLKEDTDYVFYKDLESITVLDNKTYVFDYRDIGTEFELGKTYYFRVKAFNDEGIESTFSNSVKLIPRPVQPELFKVSTTKGLAIFNIKPSRVKVDGYELYYKTSSGYKLLKELTLNEIENNIEMKATSGKTNSYSIRSYINSNGEKIYSPYYQLQKIKIK